MTATITVRMTRIKISFHEPTKSCTHWQAFGLWRQGVGTRGCSRPSAARRLRVVRAHARRSLVRQTARSGMDGQPGSKEGQKVKQK